MTRALDELVQGGIGGIAGTTTMSLVLWAAGLLGHLPPTRMARAALRVRGEVAPSRGRTGVLATALHYGYGTSMGALFGMVDHRLRLPGRPAVRGVIFASIVYLLSYKGWVPA